VNIRDYIFSLFPYLIQPTSEEGYQESAQSSNPGKAKSSKLDLSGRQGFSNPFGYLMGNGGLCGGRADNKASSTSGASPFSDQSQRDQGSRVQNIAGNNVTDMAVCCDICNTKFGFLTRKKTCSECRLLFCSSCITSIAAKKVPDPKHNNGSTGLIKVCARCQVLLKTPPIKADLMELRVKDLQRYLMSNKISTKDCVEKKDLVELVMKENGGQVQSSQRQPDTSGRPSSSTNNNSASRPSSNTSASNTRNPRNLGPVEREQQNFPRSYVQSTHRQDFFERFTANNDVDEESESQRNDNAPNKSSASWMSDSEDKIREDSSKCDNSSRSSSAENAKSSPNRTDLNTSSSFTPVEAFEDLNSNETIHLSREKEVTEETPVESMDVSSVPTSPINQRNLHPKNSPEKTEDSRQDGAGRDGEHVSEKKNEDIDQKTSNTELDKDQERIEGAVGGLGVSAPSPILSTKLSPSPKRFAKQDLVYLSEIESIEELSDLSATQLKKLLAMNRVTFKGVVEKEELLKIVTRLWKQEQKAEEGKDCIRDEELCKICMDHPVDCVMLECGHMCTCTRCGKQMAECPICRQYVVRVVRTFKA